MTQFANPEFFLLLLLLIPLQLALIFRSRVFRFLRDALGLGGRVEGLKLFEKKQVKNLPKSLRQRLAYLPEWLGLIAAFFLVFALARPQSVEKMIQRSSESIDIMLVVDISDSMLIEDMEPLNRLEAAKVRFSQFVDRRPNDRIGVVIFAGEAFTLVPLTFDHVLVKERLASLKTAQQARIKDGTAIGVGMATGAMRLKDSEAKSRVMVFMTDGENNTGTIDPITGLELAKGYGIRIYTIGLGRDGPTQIPIMTRDAFGNQVKVYQPFESFVNDELLSRMARETGGVYYRATTGTELQNLLNDVDRLERTRVQATEFTQYEELFWWPLTVGLVLFLMSVILGWTYLLRLP